MKKIKGVIVVLAGLFIMITLLSLLMPSRVMTVRSVVIHAKQADVLAEISDLKKWKDWHPVFRQDSNNIIISNPSAGVNAFATWNTNGKENKLLITENSVNHIKVSLLRKGENEAINIISINLVNDSSAIQVEWRTLNSLKWYPWEKFSGIFIDKMTGPGYEMALNNLKEFTEPKSR